MPFPGPDSFPGPDVFPGGIYDTDAIGNELFRNLAPIAEAYGDTGALIVFCRALGAMMQPVDDLVKDGVEGQPGWSQALDKARAKDEWLPWLGQWVGYLVPAKAATENQITWSDRERIRITSRSAHRRGTIALLREVVQEHLNNPKDVLIQERVGTAHIINVYVYDYQIATTVPQVTAAALAQKAAGLIMNFIVLTGNNYSLLQASNASYTVMTGKHANYSSVLTNPGL